MVEHISNIKITQVPVYGDPRIIERDYEEEVSFTLGNNIIKLSDGNFGNAEINGERRYFYGDEQFALKCVFHDIKVTRNSFYVHDTICLEIPECLRKKLK